MQYPERLFSQRPAESIRIEKLSDGSLVICDLLSKRVHSLNPTAAAAWEACARAASEPTILAAVQAKVGPSIDEEAVWSAIQSLQEADLIHVQEPELETVAAPILGQSRRRVLANLGVAIAVPAVITLTMADQKAYAVESKSLPPHQYPS